jgi:hypothetical protein
MLDAGAEDAQIDERNLGDTQAGNDRLRKTNPLNAPRAG